MEKKTWNGLFIIFTFISCNSVKNYKEINIFKDEKIMNFVEAPLLTGFISYNQAKVYYFKDSIIVTPLNPMHNGLIFYNDSDFLDCLKQKHFPVKDSFIISSYLTQDHFEFDNFIKKRLKNINLKNNKDFDLEKISVIELKEIQQYLSKDSNEDNFLYALIFGLYVKNELQLDAKGIFGIYKNLGSLNPLYEPILVDTLNSQYYVLQKYADEILSSETEIKEAFLLTTRFFKKNNDFVIVTKQ